MDKYSVLKELIDIFQEITGCVIEIEHNLAPKVKEKKIREAILSENTAIDKCMTRLENNINVNGEGEYTA